MKQFSQILLFLTISTVFTACRQQSIYTINNWDIRIDSQEGRIDLSNAELGDVFSNVNLFSGRNGNKCLKNWSVEKKDTILRVTTKDPVTVWLIKFSKNGVDFSTTEGNTFIRGTAFAPERRIPARVAEQDNDIIYTQMGFVSATNIHNLFDMDSDIMIRFPESCSLKRNVGNNKLMNVTTPVVSGSEIELVPGYYDNVIGLSKYSAVSNNSYNNVTITPESVENISKDSSKLFIPHYIPISDRFRSAPTGWSSWYCYYMYPTEESLFAETKAIAQKLKPYGLKYIQLDAAYTRGAEANWLNWNKELYPSGGKAWFRYVRKNGLVPGLWMNVYGANYTKPSMADSYPDNFFLKENGKLIRACCSSDSTLKCLDYSNPAVFEKHLSPLMDTLINSWGLGYLKAGGGGKWMDKYEKNRKDAFNPDLKSRDVYRKVLSLLREKLGDDRYILGCSLHEIGVGFGYFDGSRSGLDDYANWYGENHASTGMQSFFNTIFTNAYLNGIVWLTDPDDVMVRDPLTMEEGKTIVSTLSLSGQAYIVSDYIAEFTAERKSKFINSEYDINWAKNYPDFVKPLQEEKLELYKRTLPAMPIRAMDLYPYQTEPKFFQLTKHFPKALDLKVNSASGAYDVVALYNWQDVDTIKAIDLYNDLGLEKDADYVAFDFWDSKLINVKNGKIEQFIPKHGTKALIIRQKQDHLFLMAVSRHLTSAYSIKKYNWNKTDKVMSGSSVVVPGDEYNLYAYIPERYGMKNLKVKGTADVEVKKTEPNLVVLTFTPEYDFIDWSIQVVD
ncbi:MAG: hypothetical protein GXO47_12935 [Chlorobi bacterium]|nr:hypothetical protein [Chlorobiota bacterium]